MVHVSIIIIMLYFLVITDLHTGTLPSLKPAPIDSTLGIYVGNFVICNVLYLHGM